MNIDRPSVREAESSSFLVRAMTSILAAVWHAGDPDLAAVQAPAVGVGLGIGA
jgi:hypothetical protein